MDQPPDDEIGVWQRRDIGSARSERIAASRKRTLSHRVEDDIVAIAAAKEALLAVVDNGVGPKRADEVDVRRPAGCGRYGPERLGDLDREMPDAASRAMDEDLRPFGDAANVA